MFFSDFKVMNYQEITSALRMWITTGQKEKKSKPKAFPADKMIPTVHVISIVMPISRFCFKTIVQLSLDLKQSYNRFSLHRFGGAWRALY